MEVNRIQPSFGMAVVINPAQEKEVNRYISRLPYEQAVKFSLAKMNQKEKSPDIILSLVKNFWGQTRIKATVGLKEYTEGFRFNPAETIQKAEQEANRVYEYQTQRNEFLKGMTIPKLY